jgi:outer membrane murein-binding lipoprotein Lpp
MQEAWCSKSAAPPPIYQMIKNTMLVLFIATVGYLMISGCMDEMIAEQDRVAENAAMVNQ